MQQRAAATPFLLSSLLFRSTIRALTLSCMALLPGAALAQLPAAQPAFDVASIRPSSSSVEFERNGITRADHGTLFMHAVTVLTCIEYAWHLSAPLVSGPAFLAQTHYDIIARTDPATTEAQLRLMMQSLLTERFHLAFHRETKQLRVYNLVVARNGAKSGLKIKPTTSPDIAMSHQNSATGMVGHAATIQDIADYIADPLNAPITDGTGLTGRYDFTIDFTPYVDTGQSDVRPDPAAVITRALKGELGLDAVRTEKPVSVLIIDHVDPPTPN